MSDSRIAEKIELGVDIARLWESFQPILKSYPPTHRSPAFGGWALQGLKSATVSDGWSMDFCPFNGPGNRGPTWTPQTDLERGLSSIQDYVHPTPALTPEFAKLIEKLEELGLNPRRSRIIRLMPGSSTVWHQDGSKRIYQARIHIPLVTNLDCKFETDEGAYHMPADGSGYLVHINRMHRAYNHGDEIRYHFVSHIWDQKGVSRHHRYDPELYSGETIHESQIAPGSLFDLQRPV